MKSYKIKVPQCIVVCGSAIYQLGPAVRPSAIVVYIDSDSVKLVIAWASLLPWCHT